jgi:hypothetical protein
MQAEEITIIISCRKNLAAEFTIDQETQVEVTECKLVVPPCCVFMVSRSEINQVALRR